MPTPMKETAEDRAVKDKVQSTAQKEITQIVNGAESLLAQMAEIAEELKEHWQDAKDRGYSVTALKRVVRDRKRDVGEVQYETTAYEQYADAVGLKIHGGH